jgi:hypothetical protein
MHIVVKLSKFYDWEPVPVGVPVTPQDIASEKVKPNAAGGYLMKVTKSPPGGTFTTVHLPEEQVIAKIIHEKCRPEGGRTLTRTEAVAFYLGENVMPHQAHRTWIKGFDVHDDGPDEKMMRATLALHTVSETARVDACKTANTHTYIGEISVGEGSTAATMKVTPQCHKCGHHEGAETVDVPNIDPAEVEAHVKAYLQPATAKDHIAHLSKHFKVKAVSL